MANEDIFDKYRMEIEKSRIIAEQENLSNMQLSNQIKKEEDSSISKQLDLNPYIERIYYLLNGYSLKPDQHNRLLWTAPSDTKLNIFTPYGIDFVMNTICWYLDQNTLMTNLDDVQINKKMLRFSEDFICSIFIDYDKIFRRPTTEECMADIEKRLEDKIKISFLASKLSGENRTEEEIRLEKLKEVEGMLESEIEKIRQKFIKDNLKRIYLIVREVTDSIHITYQRSWKGIERQTARQHMTVSENRGLTPNPQKTGGLFSWGKK